MLAIIKKEMIQQVRDYKGLVMMTIMPIIVIWVMTVVFGNMFNVPVDFDKIIVSQVNQMKEETEAHLSFSDFQEGKDVLAHHETSILIDQDKVYVNKSYLKEAYFAWLSYGSPSEDQVSIKTEKLERRFSQTEVANYYGIAMCLLFALYNIPFHISSVMKEKNNDLKNRILLGPLSNFTFLAGKILGNFLIASVQVTIVFASSIVFFQINWGNILISWLMIESYLLLLVTLGILIGTLLKNENIAMGMIHILIVIFAFFGGGYMPIDTLKITHVYGKFISPLWWMMKGTIANVYQVDSNQMLSTFTFNILALIIITGLAYIFDKKKGAYNV